ncbi:MAG: hypothetical protein M3444_12265, partial [Acidobacteriota bacterium]|nr:hypothetical protein [Acidobacteriota bacterium]
TTLSKGEVARIMALVKSYLKKHSSISNRTLRELAGIGYDQAIYFFNMMVNERQLERGGKGSGTCYTLPKAGPRPIRRKA